MMSSYLGWELPSTDCTRAIFVFSSEMKKSTSWKWTWRGGHVIGGHVIGGHVIGSHVIGGHVVYWRSRDWRSCNWKSRDWRSRDWRSRDWRSRGLLEVMWLHASCLICIKEDDLYFKSKSGMRDELLEEIFFLLKIFLSICIILTIRLFYSFSSSNDFTKASKELYHAESHAKEKPGNLCLHLSSFI